MNTTTFTSNIIQDNTNLKTLIAENPTLPVVILAGHDISHSGWGYNYITTPICTIVEVLDCSLPFCKNYIYDNRASFSADLASYLDNESTEDMTNEEFKEYVSKEESKYESYWRKVIGVYI